MNSIRIAIAMVVALASTSAAQAACDPVPYTTKMANVGGEMQASLASKLARGLLKYVPVGSDGTVGSEYVANSISGTQYDAYSAVIENFRCRVNEELQRGIAKGKIVQDDADRFDGNVDVLASFLVDLSNASAQASAAKQGIGQALLKLDEQQTNTLAGRLKPISSETRAAVKRVTDKVTAKDFTEIKRVTGWVKLRSSYGDLNLCGGAIFAISEEMHPVLQVALSQLPQFFNRFVRGDAMSTGPVKPFLVSYASVAQTPITATAPTMTEQFRGCTNQLVDKLDQITPEKLKSKG